MQCSINDVFQSFDLTPALGHDIHRVFDRNINRLKVILSV